jgi:hypothetical protein
VPLSTPTPASPATPCRSSHLVLAARGTAVEACGVGAASEVAAGLAGVRGVVWSQQRYQPGYTPFWSAARRPSCSITWSVPAGTVALCQDSPEPQPTALTEITSVAPGSGSTGSRSGRRAPIGSPVGVKVYRPCMFRRRSSSEDSRAACSSGTE